MLKFKLLNIVFVLIIAVVAIFNILGFKYAWVLLLTAFVIYLLVVIIGVVKVKWQFFMPIICSFPNKKNQVFLSFDDGPTKQTEAILKLLKEYNATGNFFCIGKQLEKKPELAKQLADDGHLIGNHSYSHTNIFPLKSQSKILEEIRKTNFIIEKITGRPNRFFRPPFGVSNPNIARAIQKLNMINIGWSIRSFDTQDKKGTKALDKITTNLKAGDIVLLHDNSPRVLFILEQLLIFLRENNFSTQRIDGSIKH